MYTRLLGTQEYFLSGHGTYKVTATPMSSLGFQTTSETFQMRYCVTFYLKGHQNCQKSKLKFQKNPLLYNKLHMSKSLTSVSFDVP